MAKSDIVADMRIALSELGSSEKNAQKIFANIKELEERKIKLIIEIIELCKTYEGIESFRQDKDKSGLLVKLEHVTKLEARYLRLQKDAWSRVTYDWLDEEVDELLEYRIPKGKDVIKDYFNYLDKIDNTVEDAFKIWEERTEKEAEFIEKVRISLVGNLWHKLTDALFARKESVVKNFKKYMLSYIAYFNESAAKKAGIARRLKDSDQEMRIKTAKLLKLLKNKKLVLQPIPEETENYVSRRSSSSSSHSSDDGFGGISGGGLGGGGSDFGGFGGGSSGGGGASGSW